MQKNCHVSNMSGFVSYLKLDLTWKRSESLSVSVGRAPTDSHAWQEQ